MDKTHNFKIGDTVFFDAGHIEHGTIEAFSELDGKPWAKIRCKVIPGTTSRPIEDLHRSEKDCYDAIKAYSEKIKNEYRQQIKTVDDLVIFLFNHDTNDCECGDYEARAVAIEKAQELLGMSETRLLGMEPNA